MFGGLNNYNHCKDLNKPNAIAYIINAIAISRKVHTFIDLKYGASNFAPYPKLKKNINDALAAKKAKIIFSDNLSYCTDIAPRRTIVSKYTCGLSQVTAAKLVKTLEIDFGSPFISTLYAPR